jgi:hypothetical protein
MEGLVSRNKSSLPANLLEMNYPSPPFSPKLPLHRRVLTEKDPNLVKDNAPSNTSRSTPVIEHAKQ